MFRAIGNNLTDLLRAGWQDDGHRLAAIVTALILAIGGRSVTGQNKFCSDDLA
jgi:hypothetical protein